MCIAVLIVSLGDGVCLCVYVCVKDRRTDRQRGVFHIITV